MKRQPVIKKLAEQGAVLVRHGTGHDLYRQPKTGNQESVTRHTDINERLAKSIIKRLS